MSRPGANPALVAKLEQERQLRAGISGHKTGLPKKLLELFAPLPPLPFKDTIRKRKPKTGYSGIAQYVDLFAKPGEDEYEPKAESSLPEPRLFRNPEMPLQARVEGPLKLERVITKRKAATRRADKRLGRDVEEWDPAHNPQIQGDPFKTLFVGRLSFDATEKKLQREFEEYGPIKAVTLVHSTKSGKLRGYAFIEFEHKEDMKNAYKLADGRKVEGRRVTVDVERGRTVPGWKPRRLAGGKGGETRVAREPKNPNRRVARGLAPTPGGKGLLPGPAAASRAPPREERPEPARREERPAAALPGPPAPPPATNNWPVSSGTQDRDRERAHDRERERERERPVREARDRSDREYVERSRTERDRERTDRERADRDRGRDDRGRADRSDRSRDRGSGRERERDRDAGRDRGRDRTRDRDAAGDRDRDRSGKRERDREAGEVDDRSSKRYRDERERERSSSRRRERDL